MENNEQTVQSTDNQVVKQPSSLKRKVLFVLTSFCALAVAGTGYVYHKIQDYGKQSTAIGKAVGDYVTKIQAERKKLNAITQQASCNRADYTQECKDMVDIVTSSIRKYPNKTPQEIIDLSCHKFAKFHTGNPKADIILEDMRAVQKYIVGSNRDLHVCMCYYHKSPEVPFQNRFSDASDVRESIYRYELKARRDLYETNKIKRSSMFDASRQNF